MDWTETDIQALKAQEAKDLAVELLHKLESKEKGPISPGEVQIKELDFEVRLREAQSEDNRLREAHDRQIKELELQIQQEKTRSAQEESRADQVRESFADVARRVDQASESLSIQFERATREHNLKVEQLESTFSARQEELSEQLSELEQQRDTLRDEINILADLHEEAQEVGRLREEVERRKKESRGEHAQTEEQVAAAEFEKTKKIGEAKRSQELELAQLDAQHQTDVLQRNRQAAESILESLEMIAVEKEHWQRMHEETQAARDRTEQEAAQIREASRDEFRREFNITRTETVDVTDLFYREQAARSEVERLGTQLDKLDAEICRMRQHIEQEPQRISSAIEAAKTQVHNYIEQGPKR
ncbi:MAG: hypothetical protein IID44_00565 [Planctomycetes bacterium]|nr:hypothetical protein [Planctomycetota bacterium]